MTIDADETQESNPEEAAAFPEQRGHVYFGGIYWHEPDERGCNWSVSTISGRNWSDSLGRLTPFAEQLRTRYNSGNSAKGISYHDCHVSIEAIPQTRGERNEFVSSWMIVKGARVRKFGATARTYPSADEALVAGEALAIQDVDQAYKDGWLA